MIYVEDALLILVIFGVPVACLVSRTVEVIHNRRRYRRNFWRAVHTFAARHYTAAINDCIVENERLRLHQELEQVLAYGDEEDE